MKSENINTFDGSSLQLIARLSKGGMRDSITTLEKCLGFSKNLTVSNITQALGVVGYDSMFYGCKSIVEVESFPATTVAKDCCHYMFMNCSALTTAPALPDVLSRIETLYLNGLDIKVFVVSFLQFVLDISRYIVTKDFCVSYLPDDYKSKIDGLSLNKEQLANLVDGLVKLNSYIKYESNPFVFVQAFLLKVSI